ncbi:MAG: formate/nitrite transporter family protein [Eubacterium sp.]|nr:formate/nitrite transporter family protein [Eubacterium sp.]
MSGGADKKGYVRMFALAVLAGVAIGIGGIVYLSMENKTAGALLFTVGLYTICIHGLNLYTGKVGYLVGQPFSYLFDLLLIWCGNFAGTALAAAAVCQTRLQKLSGAAQALCTVKLEDTLSSLFLLGVFCGFLMFVAVDGYRATQKPVILFLGVAAFILCGFEHCIADMFYFSAAGSWSGDAFVRIVVITLGNSAGGVLLPLVKKG